MDQAYKGV
jgi:hypothetical protein